jgi:hypothetical protein
VPLFTAAALLLLTLGVLRLWLATPGGRPALLLLALYLLVPLLATWWSAQGRPIFNERYLIAALPPFFLLLASAFGGEWELGVRRFAGRGSREPQSAPSQAPTIALQLAAALLGGVLLTAMSLSLLRGYGDPAYSKNRGWRELADVIVRMGEGLPAPAVRVAQNFPDPTLWYYYRGPIDHLVLPPAANDAAGARAAAQALAGEGVQRVILPVQPAANWDTGGIATEALDGWYDRTAQLQVGVWPLQIYTRPPGALTPLGVTPLGVQFGEDVVLRGFVAAPETLPPGGLLAVHLDWGQVAPVNGDDAAEGAAAGGAGERKVFVQLLNGSGELVAQDDRPLVFSGPRAAGSGLAAYGLVLPQELDEGPYRLIAGIYDPAQPGAPRAETAEGADHVVLREY